MSLFDTLFPQQRRASKRRRPDNQGRAEGRVRTVASRNRLRHLGYGEQLERRDLLAVTVVQETPTTFFTDFSRNFSSEYASYTITNIDSGPIDAWVKVTFPAGSVVGLGPGYNNEDGLYRVGTLNNGEFNEAFLYYTAKSNTAVAQPYSLEVWNGKPGEPGSSQLAANLTPASLAFDSVVDTLAAEPNKVSSVTISPIAPAVGDIMTMTVAGKLGSGANRVLFAPATRSDWQPDIFELRDVTNVISGTARTPDRIFYDGLPGGGSDEKPFTSVYEFLVTGPITTPTPVDPTQWTQDGKQPWKHHKPDDTPFPPIPPITYELSISKTDGKATYTPGGTTTYTVTLQNTGKAAANNVLVTDTLPPQIDPTSTWTVTYSGGATSGPLPGGLGNGGTGDISGTVNLAALTGTVVITINAKILPDASGAMVNTVSATAPGDLPISATDTNLDINLSLTKDDSKTTYTPGGTTTYTIVLQNTGLAELNGITLKDELPDQIDQTSTWSAVYTGGASSGTLGNNGVGDFINKTVNLGGLGGTVTITINAKILSSATGQMTNTIFATLATGGPPLSASDTNAPVRDERLTLTKDNKQETYIPGTTTTYTIVLSNIGLSDVNGIIVSDDLPVQLDPLTTTWFATYTNAAGTLPTLPTTGDILGTVTTLKGSVGVVTITINGVILSTATGDMVNTVNAKNSISLSSTDRDTAAPEVDLAVTKTRTSPVPPLPVIAGEAVTYTITVTSNGPSAITTFSGVDITVPALLSPSYTVDNGTYDPDTKTWTAGAGDFFTPGEVITFTLTGTVPADATGTLTNTATATPPVKDPNPQNNTSTATDTIVVKPVLSVTKTDGSATYIPGDPVTYTIVVSNSGPSDLVGGSVVDLLPSVATSGSWTTSTTGGATVLPTTGGNNIDATVNIPASGSVTFFYTVQTKPIVIPIDPVTGPYPDLFNLVTVSPPQGTAGNTATATDNDTAAPQVDLAVSKTRTSPLPVIAGEVVTYSIVVTSNGPSSITSFSGTDVSVPGLLSPTYSVSTGTYDPNTGLWTANPGDTFDKGETVTFTLSGTVPAGATGTLTNTATGTPPIFDPNPDNNTSTATDTIVVKPVLSITKTASPLIVRAGEGGYKFQLTVKNTGPSDAVGVSVVDTLPVGFTATAFSPSAGVLPLAPTAGPFTWTIGTLAAGATTILDITYGVAASVPESTQTNTAVVKIGEEVKGTAQVSVDVEGVQPPLSVTPGIVVGSDDGCNGPPWVRVLDPNSGVELSRFLAYDPRFRGSVRVATGDVTGDGVAEIITAPSRNLVGEVRVFQRIPFNAAQQNGNGVSEEWTELTQYRTLAFGPRYRGGVEVAIANIDGIPGNEIVTAMSIQSGMVNVFKVTPGAVDPVANSPFRSFRGAPAGFNNGVMISAGDYINGGILGGPAEIAVGTNSGTRALVRIFDVSGTPKVVRSFNPFANGFRGGVTLSTADYDGNGSLDLIIGAGLNGGSRVEVWNPATTSRIAQTSVFSSLAKPNARVFAVFGTSADGFLGPDSTLYGVQGLNGGRGSKGVWKVLSGKAESLVNSQTSLPPLRIAPIGLPLAPTAPRLG